MTWSCKGSSVAPLTDYINNPICQELIDEDYYFHSRRDKIIYLDLGASSGYTRRDKIIYLDLGASSGYTSEAKKLERNDSKINLLLKAAASQKQSLGALNR